MSNLIISPLGTPWITQATWSLEAPREAAHRRRDRRRGRRGRRSDQETDA